MTNESEDFEYHEEAGFETIRLFHGRSLSRTPKWSRQLITADWNRILEDPVSHYRQIAARCPFPTMRNYLEMMVARSNWTLEFSRLKFDEDDDEEGGTVGIRWGYHGPTVADDGAETIFLDGPYGVRLGLPPLGSETHLPQDLRVFYTLVGDVRWGGASQGGSLRSAPHDRFDPRSNPYPPETLSFDPESTYEWGHTVHGELLVYTLEGVAGWADYSGGFQPLGTVRDAIEWVFSCLLRGEEPTPGID